MQESGSATSAASSSTCRAVSLERKESAHVLRITRVPRSSSGGGRLLEDPSLRLVVAGHSHVPELEEVAPGRFYVNSGDWVRHRTYVVLAPDGSAPQLRNWSSD